jgi:hypothetical protein
MLVGLALSAFATTTAAAQSAERARPQLSYELQRYDRTELASAPGDAGDWQRADLLRAALDKTSARENRPLIEGWITASAYGRLYWNREDYLVFAPKLKTPLADVCHVVVTDVVHSFTQPQLYAGGGGGGDRWCSEPGRSDFMPTPDQVRAKWPRGSVSDVATFQSSEGIAITVRHVVGIKQYGWPLPPANVTKILTIGLLPISLESARRYDRRIEVLRLAGGRWGVTLKHSLSLSGCFLMTSQPAMLPSEDWVTPEVETWCRDHDARYLASIPPAQRPALMPIVGPARKSWADEW